MTVAQVLDHFGSISNTAKALDISYQAVAQWVEADQVPEGRQFEIQLMTDGSLVAQKKQSA